MLLLSGESKLLRRNHGSDYPTRLLYLDTETTESKGDPYRRHAFRLGWTLYVRQRSERGKRQCTWRYWTNRNKLLAYIESLLKGKSTLWLVGHNLYYDIQALGFYDYIGYRGYEEEFFYDCGLVYLHFLQKGSAHLKLVSSTNYFDCSLRELGEAVGLQKYNIDFNLAGNDELCIYCFRDVEILYEAMCRYMEFNKAHDTGRFGYTKASQALNCYRHRFMRKKIYIHRVEKVVDLERSAYFGGRTECWQLGEIEGGQKVFLDVNSMYPYVMKKYRYPTRLRMYLEGKEASLALDYLESSSVVAEVSLQTDEPIYAMRRDGKLIFPVGTFRTFLCTGALRRARDAGHIRAVHRAAVYSCDYIFSEYVDYWYALKCKYKREGNTIYTRIVKLFLNSLYGKFGQKKPVVETYLDPAAGPPRSCITMSAETGECWVERSAFGKIYRQVGEENGDKSLVAVAAHVSEYSRLALWDLCTAVGSERVYYMDTDSICILAGDIHRINDSIHGQRLGALSVDKVCETLVLCGPKHYFHDGKRVCKGVPKKAEQVGEHLYRYEQFLGSASHMRIAETKEFLVRETRKSVTPTYDKGEVLPSGRVIPWVLDEQS